MFLLFTFFLTTPLSAQTANDEVPPFEGLFAVGVNPGSYAYAGGSQFWTDEEKADIAATGAGIDAFRLPLFEFFLEQWGYDIRQSTFQYYQSLGMRDHTVFIGFPSMAHRDNTSYCPGQPSELFANMYTPIWDNGANGTPYNDDNYFARYVYEMVKIYQPFTKFWEVLNEPDFTSSSNAFLPSGTAGSWWDVDALPCELPNLRAPVYHYIRMLRISYEVIKTLDPEAYVAIGGIGFPSFLHMVLRNTDNPDGGQPSADFPLTGGAYFDVVSYHGYPHINGSLRYWNNQIQDWTYTRHSEAAAEGMIALKKDFEAVLSAFGYDGTTYPAKEWIITETNLPRKGINFSYGGDEAQRNFVMKMVLRSQAEEIRQVDFFALGERREEATVTEEWQLFDLMGMYKNLEGTTPGTQQITESGIACRTMYEILGGMVYDEEKTTELQLPLPLQGLAFKSATGEDRVYVLWVRNTLDNTETASGQFLFPPDLQEALHRYEHLNIKYWDAAYTQDSLLFDPNLPVFLTATPVFIQAKGIQTVAVRERSEFSFKLAPNPAKDQIHIQLAQPPSKATSLTLRSIDGVAINKWELNAQQSWLSLPADLARGCYFLELRQGGLLRGTNRLIKL
ncbi:MAG: hypothetical protein AAGG75_22325 [Bacteroidota bacterium]